jgi:hypothetical protein
MRDCLQWLDAARMKGGESCLDQVTARPPSAPGSTAPGTEKPRWSAARRVRPTGTHAALQGAD